MNSPPKFFDINLLDLSNKNVSITVIDGVAKSTGQLNVDLMRNRDNFSGWGTTGSNDGANTTLEVDYKELLEKRTLIISGHNIASLKVEKWNGSAYVDFATPVDITGNTEDVLEIDLGPEEVFSKFRIILRGTMVANEDKFITQLILTDPIGAGQLTFYPEITEYQFGPDKGENQAISGKSHIFETVGSAGLQMSVKGVATKADMDIFEQIVLFRRRGFLFWPCGGVDQEVSAGGQFSRKTEGWKRKDIFHMKTKTKWNPVWYEQIYTSSLDIKIGMVEAI